MNRATSKESMEGVPANSKTIKMALRSLSRSFTMTLLVCLYLLTSLTPVLFASSSLLHKEAPEFVRTDLMHQKLDLQAYRGKVVLLNFWATWCAPCQLEMPRFVAWQNQYGPRGLQIIGISIDDDPALAQRLYKKLKLNYPVAMGDEKLGKLYGGVLGLPLTYLIDSQGKVMAQFQGETDLKLIEEQFKPLLRP